MRAVRKYQQNDNVLFIPVKELIFFLQRSSFSETFSIMLNRQHQDVSIELQVARVMGGSWVVARYPWYRDGRTFRQSVPAGPDFNPKLTKISSENNVVRRCSHRRNQMQVSLFFTFSKIRLFTEADIKNSSTKKNKLVAKPSCLIES